VTHARSAAAYRADHDRLYGRRWRRAAKRFLFGQPLCRLCFDIGLTVAASVVDHIQPHQGDFALFWDEGNWQSLCKPCHDGAKAQLERTGALRGCRPDGLPVDASHPWNCLGGATPADLGP